LKKRERIAYVKQIISQTNFKLLVGNKIKVLFPQNKGKGRPILNPKMVLNAILDIEKWSALERFAVALR
jgi:hypothetical protein